MTHDWSPPPAAAASAPALDAAMRERIERAATASQEEVEREAERRAQEERREERRRYFSSLRTVMDVLRAAPPQQVVDALGSAWCSYLARQGSDLERTIHYLSDLLHCVRQAAAQGQE